MDVEKFLGDPKTFRVNARKAHSDHVHFISHEEAARGTSSLYKCLDGTWQVLYSPTVEARQAHFYKEDFNSTEFRPIKVPAHAELQGFGSPQYINSMYPWEAHEMLRPPIVPTANPVLSYVRVFDLAPQQLARRVVLRFDGAQTALAVYLNGSFVGYSEDSFSPVEFDITPFVRAHANRLAVEVFKYSTASYIEDQDYFRFSGLFRSVWVYALPTAHVDDFFADCCLEGESTGTLDLSCSLSYSGRFKGTLSVKVKDGERVLCELSRDVTEETRSLSFDTQRIEGVTPYSCFCPKLYELELELYDQAGRTVEIVPYRIGFRRIEIKDARILLNGERLILCGVNRHEWSPTSGRAITRSDMEADIAIFKRNSINAVRTCHYPDNPLFYRLCDEAGIYMMAETNLESHGSWQKITGLESSWNVPGDNPDWYGAVLDRAESNFQTFKNHPAVLFWSLGNESYAGEGIRLMNELFKAHDKHRVTHYEGVYWRPELKGAISDVESRMYASPDEVRRYFREGGSKPFLLCEYMHSMGNSCGGFASYDALFDEFEGFHGGFIWDFIDQALYAVDPVTGKRMLCYGGDFGEKCTDYEFSANGIVFADRSEKPCLQEVRYFYANRLRRL